MMHRHGRLIPGDGSRGRPSGHPAAAYAGAVWLVFLLFVSILSGRGYAAPAETLTPAPSGETVETAPVMVDGRVLFYLRGVRVYPAQERARAVGERIIKVASDLSIPVDAITSIEADDMTSIVAGNYHIVSIVDADAALEGVTRQQLGSLYVQKIRAAVQEHRQARTKGSIVRGFLYASAATVIFLIALFLVFRLHRKLHAFLESVSKGRLRKLERMSRGVFGTEGIWAAVEDALKTFRFIVVLVIFYVYLEIVLGLFPWTRFYAIKLLDLVVDPLKVIGFGILNEVPNLLFIIILAILVRLFLRFVHIFFKELEVGARTIPGFYPEWAKPTERLLTFVVIAFSAVVAFPYIPGSNTAAFKGISIFLGVLFSFGSQSVVSNTIAGFIVQYRRAFRIGDYVRINDITGDVTAVRMHVTHVRTIKNEEVVVPNSTILSSHIVNYSSLAREKGLILHTEVTIGYDTPWRQVHAMLITAAERTEGLLKEPRPFVLQKSLDDFYVRYELNAYTDAPQKMVDIYSELHMNIQDSFNEYGVQIMSPHYLGDPAQAKVVPKEKWYSPPARPTGEEGKNDKRDG